MPMTDWRYEIPRYRLQRALKPAPRPRYRFEPPFSQISDHDTWQYAEREYAANEQIETKSWPHPTMIGLNESGRRTVQFFNERQKSRLRVSPWSGGRIDLDDGFSGPVITLQRPATPTFEILTDETRA
jgi:hypothetical protein